MKNLLQNKIFIILLIFILFIFNFSNVFASDVAEYPDFSNIDLSEYPEYSLDNYLLMNTGDYYLLLFKTDFNGKVYYDGSKINTSDSSKYLICRYNGNEFYPAYTNNGSTGNYGFIISSIDIYNKDDTVFFQRTPQVISQVATMEITQVEELPKAIIQIVQIILPVFLVIFGVLLVLYLIRSKNLLHL